MVVRAILPVACLLLCCGPAMAQAGGKLPFKPQVAVTYTVSADISSERAQKRLPEIADAVWKLYCEHNSACEQDTADRMDITYSRNPTGTGEYCMILFNAPPDTSAFFSCSTDGRVFLSEREIYVTPSHLVKRK